MPQRINRKTFLKSGTAWLTGIFAGLFGLTAMAKKNNSGLNTAWPYPYTILDVETVRIAGHDSFWNGLACCAGSFNAIIQALGDELGAPFTELPPEIMLYGQGGGAGWGTVCGSINGAAAAISLVCEKEDCLKLVNELYGWYTQTLLPTSLSNEYASKHSFKDNRCDVAIIPSLSGSPLCHVSVSKWCDTARAKVHDLERKERCARLAGDVAAYAVQLLNQHFNGTLSKSYQSPETIAACMACHGSGYRDNVMTKMACDQCHGDPHAQAVVEDIKVNPDHYDLTQNYPDPFNPDTTIEFYLPKSESVTLIISNLNGRLVTALPRSKVLASGKHILHWDGCDSNGKKLSSGVYFYSISTSSYHKTKSMMLLK